MPASRNINPVQKKIDQLNQHAWERRVNDSPGAFKLSRQSLAMARKIKYRKGIAEAARSMGFCYVRLSKYDEALPLLNESLSLFEALHDLKNQAVVYEYLGVIKRNRGDLGAALTLLFKAVTLSQQTGATENEAIHHYQVGVTYKYLGNFDKALDALFKSISIHKDNKNRHYQSYPIHVIGTIYFETGDYKKALEYFKEGLSIRQQFHDKLGEAGSLDTIGYTLFKVKKFQQALAFCKKALVICKATDDKRSQASTLQHLAEIYAQTGDTKQAIISSNESRRIRKLTGDKRGEAEILLFLAGLSQQDNSKVLGWIKEALKIGIITRSPDIQSKAYHSLYNYHKREGKFKEANRYLEKHYSLEKELQKNSVSQKMANLEITRKAEETRKEAELVMNKNEELTRLNSELEVEASLERVRTVAMGMKAPSDMLLVCRMISQQLQQLGFGELRNVQTVVIYPQKKEYLNYQYFTPYQKDVIERIDYELQPDVLEFTKRMLESPKAYYEKTFKGVALKRWREYRRKTNQVQDPILDAATSSHYYFYSIGSGALGVTTYAPLNDSQKELFKRFRNAFVLAYHRFKDIEKAEIRAREAQIEASVERVRAKALAMHQSNEVLLVVQSLKREMAHLGLTSGITGATIFLEQPDGWVRLWDLTSFDTALTNMDIVFRPDETDPRLYIMRIWESKKDFVVIEQDRKDFLLTIKWIRQFDRKTADEIAGLLRSHKLTHGWHPAARLQHGWLCIDLETPPSAEFEIILPKMAAAFDLAYKRFLDLQKAEAQAKEARIEASLEKVRAQALGMHKPGDLLNVCKVLFKELIQLGFDQLRNAVIHTLYDEKGYFLDHDYSDYSGGAITTIPYSDQPIIKTFLREIRRSSDAFLQVIIKGNELADWKNFRRKTGQRDDPRLKKATVLYYYIYSVGTASIGISAFQPVSEEKLDVLKRFRNVFDFAYRRYMDVAKAEEQAREAQIELGLERVRARAMAMHHSEELAELVTTVFNELNRLGFSLTSSIIWINDHANARNTLWIAGAEMKKPAQPFSITPFHKDFFSSVIHAWKARDPKWVYTLKGAKKKSFENAFLKAIPRLPLPLKKALTVPKQVVFSASFNNFGALEIVETEALDEEKFDILHRFGKVFEQTYTRFLDLQKAEAQAAEARIEASLERVRAAAMSMHKSGQLINVVEAMYNELVALGFDNIRNAQISIRNLADNTYFVSEYSDYVRLAVKEAPIDNSPLLQRIYSAMERSKDAFFQKEFAGKEYREWKKWRLQADPKQDPRIFKATSMWFHLYSLGTGYIGISTFGAITSAQTSILKRFRNVFDLAYRRYVDVAKAEVQAREAQIEVAVERVRAKALAMHRSEDLHAVVVTLKNELMGLKIPDVVAATIYLEQGDGSIRILDLTTAREETDDKVELKLDRTFRFEDTDPKLWVRRMWDRKENYFVEQADKADFNRVVKWLYTVDPAGAKLAEKIIREKKISRAWLPTVKLEKGILNIDLLEPPGPEIEPILVKMGASFDLAYKRFLDLQKAEAQTREAQIELGLERVRARAMAMQKSEELKELIGTVYTELSKLDLILDRCFITIFDNKTLSSKWWMAAPETPRSPMGLVMQYHDFPPYLAFLEAWKTRQIKWVYTLEGHTKKEWDDYMFKKTEFSQLPAIVRGNMRANKKVFLNASFNSFGCLSLATIEPLSKEHFDILLRFARVFDLTYTRFNDLKQAEAQAREAQIEAALERVRSRSMAMHKTDELLDTAELIHKELSALGINSMNVSFAFVDAEEKHGSYYSINPVDGKILPIPFVFPHTETVVMRSILSSWQKQELVNVIELNEKKTLEHQTYIGKHIRDQLEMNKIPFSIEDFVAISPKRAVLSTFNFSKGYLFNIGADRLSKTQEELMSRFARVFEQTYTRFLDLQKAEEQARESQIELALERVRARTMAMQKSEELREVIQVVYEQFVHLNINIGHAGFVMDYKTRDDYNIWIADPHGAPSQVTIPYFDSVYYNRFNEAKEKGIGFFATNLNFEEKNKFYKTLFKYVPGLPEEAKDFYFNCPGLAASTVLLENIGLYIENFSGIPYTDEENTILMRFGKVFQQTYTRFLDLQKAEAQAKEAQIEAALERVRSASMAMHASDELQNVIRVLTDQLTVLGFEFHTANFITNASMPDWEIWISSPGSNIPPKLFVPYFDHRLFNERNEAVATGKDMLTVELNAEEKASFLNYFFEHSMAKNTDDERIKWVLDQPGMALTTVVTKSFSLSVINYYGKLYTESENEVIKRLAYVFEQSYTRFLDLQKAEEQAREAQIEASLEKVRAKVMAMKSSNDLNETSLVFGEQLRKLGIDWQFSYFWLIEEDKNDNTFWITWPDNHTSTTTYSLLEADEHFRDCIIAWKNQERIHGTRVPVEQVQDWLDTFERIAADAGGVAGQVMQKKNFRDGVFYYDAMIRFGSFGILMNRPTSDEEKTIQARFATEFERAYTRFLDLKKAEAQAREAEIELALERVRAKTMAMQRSAELPEAANLLFQQVQALGMPAWSAGYCTWEEDKRSIKLWMSSEGVLQPGLSMPLTEDPSLMHFLEAHQRGETFFVEEVGGEELKKHYTYLRTLPGVKETLDDVERAGFPVPTFQIFHLAYFSKGFLLFITYERVPAAHDIFRRFANVFEQTYTRFLDLQKAEAQAKESQIQLALERVRARTMAMHTSDELGEIVGLMYQQFEELDFGFYQVLVSIYNEKKNHIEWWSKGFGEKALPQCNIIPIIDHPFSNDLLEKWKSKVEYYPHVFEGENKKSWEEYLFTGTDLKNFPEEVKQAMRGIEKVYLSDVFMKYGSLQAGGPAPLPADKAEILKRFAKVLDLAYTRMTDLQKAEAQAREAQIELGLERVRARAMAMQTSEELKGLIGTVFSELTKLDLVLTRCVIMIYNNENNDSKWWMANSEDPDNPSGFLVKAHDHPPMVAYIKNWRERNARWTYILEGQIKKDWDVFLFRETELKNLPTPVIEGMKAPDRVYLNASFNNFGNLTLASLEPLTEEHFDILLRFAKVFDLTYTRFNDLQKAEAQVREARIEASLERIRAKAMAMHHSDELDEVLVVLWEQFDVLGIRPMSAHMTVVDIPNNRFTFRETGKFGNRSFGEQVVNIDAMDIWKEAAEQWRRSEPETLNRLHFPKESLPMVWQVFQQSFASMPEDSRLTPEDYPDGIYHVAGKHPFGYIGINQVRPSTPEEDQIVIRFASEFGRAYQRFLDLKKAETQAREAQIEASLEKVRSVAMGMRKSEELTNVAIVIFKELTQLGLTALRNTELVFQDDEKGMETSYHQFYEGSAGKLQYYYRDNILLLSHEEKLRKSHSGFAELIIHENELSTWKQFRKKINAPVDPKLEDAKALYYYSYSFGKGTLSISSFIPVLPEQLFILERFKNVFELAYQRFVDIEQAEVQAKEARIEAALERVRSKAMAMHSSEDLAATIRVFYKEMESLIFTPRRCGVGLLSKGTRIAELSTMNSTAEGDSVEVIGKLKMEGHPILEGVFENWLLQKEYHPVLRGNEIKEYYSLIRPQVSFPDYSADTVQYGYFFYFPEGGVYAWTDKEMTEEELSIYRRFTSVLSLTYKRYKDLQKAEDQAREAQIEVALERVRSKAMAMHRTDDLNDAVAVVFEELDKLNLGVLRVGISVLNKEQRSGDVWVTSIDKDQAVQVSGDESFDIHPLLHGAFEAWLRQEDFSYVLEGDDLTRYYQAVEAAKFQLPESQMLSSGAEFKRQFCFVAVYNSGGLFAFRETEFPEEAKKVMRRFAGVFDLTYKRFLDLQKAEAQARESQVQLALERVRARTMAMQLSDELAEASVVLFQQFAALGQTPDRISIGIVDEINGTTDVWATNQASTQINIHFKARNDESTTIKKILNEWKAGKKSAMVDLQGEELKKWINYLREELGMSIDDSYFHGRRIHQVSFFSQGWLNITTLEPLPAETLDLLDRFADVFNLTYTRFTDLKKAEAQAQKANIEVALERVRARALAMQEPEELIQVAEVLRHEMGALGVEELETCSIYIHDESIHRTECWYALKNAGNNDNKLINDHFSLELGDTWVGREMLNFFRSPNKQVSIVMQGANREEWIRYCESRSVPLRGYYGEEIPDRTYHLYKFSHGAIGAAAAGDISKESWDLLNRTASVFSLAYSRFKDLTQARSDLQNLKEEKLRAEKALEDLQVTQRQLVQSEKMASLGELTAGIAHEIQNPLNFVNNFSEVSNELIDEMVEEVAKGNLDEARAIAEDVKQNLEKINHHGKRADGIVKGMLQHSRSSSGQKELTDVNALADEYLRLAYHGLRAKDKTFNAKFEANLDQSLPKISIVPQDIGRVILNLITNAFYVVAEKKKKSQNGYEPAVTVSTKNYNDKIEVKVEDNGSGIPSHVLDKIFQPFFTTKPTGQGTGLGLSLSYDIVKAHGGELKVETSENEGSRFFIYLPVE